MTILSHNKQNIRILVVLYLFSFLPFFLAFRLGSGGRISAQMIFLTGIVLRLTLLASYPIFSDDIFRYLWEGKMQIKGLNPYLTAPADAATIPYRDEYFEQINHKIIPTIYPPLSELFFRVCMKTAYNLYFLKGMLIALDLGLLAFLYLIISNCGIPVYYLLIYAWHPLVIVEIAGSGHQDIIGMFFLAGCLYFRQTRNLTGSSLMLTGSFLSKLFPLFLFPLLLRRAHKWPYLIPVCLTILFYAPFYSSDFHLFTGLAAYSKAWQANDSIFFVLKILFKKSFTGKIFIIFIFLGIYLYTYSKISSFHKACFTTLGSFLILSPTLHPWYLLWIIPFLVSWATMIIKEILKLKFTIP